MYHNEGGGKFRDVTAELGLDSTAAGARASAPAITTTTALPICSSLTGARTCCTATSAASRFEDVTAKMRPHAGPRPLQHRLRFLDYDNDGKLDLFVANYLKFDFETTPKPGANPYCFYRGIAVNCGPRGLPFDRNLLYHNEGGVFRDVSDESGISKPDGNYSLGVLTGDFNGDGLTDIYVACDQTPRSSTSTRATASSWTRRCCAARRSTRTAKRCPAWAWRPRITCTRACRRSSAPTFPTSSRRCTATAAKASSRTPAWNPGWARTRRFVGWGCGFFDFDNDGWPDLLLVNGHAFPEVDRLKIDIHYRERAILYRNEHGKFIDVSEASGPGNPGTALLPRRRLRRLRQRRRSGSAGQQPERAAVAAAPSGQARKSLDHAEARRREGEPQRDRRARAITAGEH